MANSKFLSRVISYQLDFNTGLTDLYRKLIKFSKTTNIDENRINDFYYVLNKPKTLNTTNSNDLISNADQVATAIVKILTGENSEQTEDDNKVKDLLYKAVIKDMLPMFDWNKLDETYKSVKIEAAQAATVKKANEESSGGDSY